MKFDNMDEMDNINTMDYIKCDHMNENNWIDHNDAIKLDNMMGAWLHGYSNNSWSW
jgi:pectate lyase